MRKLRSAMNKLVGAAKRPTESWQVLREGVHELHFALEQLTRLVGDLDAYLARYDRAPVDAQARDALKPAPSRRRRTPGKRSHSAS